jgi:putative ABC transport system permease protein
VTVLPLAGEGGGDPLDVRGREGGWDKVGPVVRNRRVSPDYFTAMGIPLRAGRLLDATDASGTTNAVVIDEQTAKLYFPNEDPIGRQLRYVGDNTTNDWLTVVGVVGNTATTNLRESVPVAKFYAPLRTAIRASINSSHRATYVLHTRGNPIGTLPAVRRVIAELNPNVAIASPEPLADVVARAGASLAFTMILLVLAAAVALALGVIGVYAVISYGVAQRTTEIGVRLALGAGPADVVRMIVRQNAVHIGLGVLLGVGAAVSTARLMQALLFGVSWRHPLIYVAVSAALFMVAMLACWVPARRAATLSPTQALRS